MSLYGNRQLLTIRLSTALREFAALRGLPYYEPEILRDILAGRSAQLPRLSESDIRKAMTAYEVNEPQAKAILGSTSVDGFALIQGCALSLIAGKPGADEADLRVPARPRQSAVSSASGYQNGQT